MMVKRLAVAAIIATGAAAPAPALAGNARGLSYTPQAGDTPLRIKCRTEAYQMINGGKGAALYAEYNRQIRREHFKKCMSGG